MQLTSGYIISTALKRVFCVCITNATTEVNNDCLLPIRHHYHLHLITDLTYRFPSRVWTKNVPAINCLNTNNNHRTPIRVSNKTQQKAMKKKRTWWWTLAVKYAREEPYPAMHPPIGSLYSDSIKGCISTAYKISSSFLYTLATITIIQQLLFFT